MTFATDQPARSQIIETIQSSQLFQVVTGAHMNRNEFGTAIYDQIRKINLPDWTLGQIQDLATELWPAYLELFRAPQTPSAKMGEQAGETSSDAPSVKGDEQASETSSDAPSVKMVGRVGETNEDAPSVKMVERVGETNEDAPSVKMVGRVGETSSDAPSVKMATQADPEPEADAMITETITEVIIPENGSQALKVVTKSTEYGMVCEYSRIAIPETSAEEFSSTTSQDEPEKTHDDDISVMDDINTTLVPPALVSLMSKLCQMDNKSIEKFRCSQPVEYSEMKAFFEKHIYDDPVGVTEMIASNPEKEMLFINNQLVKLIHDRKYNLSVRVKCAGILASARAPGSPKSLGLHIVHGSVFPSLVRDVLERGTDKDCEICSVQIVPRLAVFYQNYVGYPSIYKLITPQAIMTLFEARISRSGFLCHVIGHNYKKLVKVLVDNPVNCNEFKIFINQKADSPSNVSVREKLRDKFRELNALF